MAARVKLRDVVEAIDLGNESWQSYLNRDTGEIVNVTDEGRDLVECDAEGDDLTDALHGRGAFRMFKSAIRRLGIEEDWYRFRDSAFEEIARDWLESNEIEYE